MATNNKKQWSAVYEEDDPAFQNIMGGPHYNIENAADGEVVATVWLDDNLSKCRRDALLLAAAPNLLRACRAALDWADAQDEDLLPNWVQKMAKAVRKTDK
jgi:hypothetical protein